MPLQFLVKATGIKETQANLTKITGGMKDALTGAIRKTTGRWEGSARKNAPVDTGVLRASITSSVTSGANSVKGVTGSNVVYAGYVEEGTPPHFPPLQTLEGWARRHGTTAIIVARAIAKRGTKATRYLGRAFDDNKERALKYVEDAIRGLLNG